MPWRSCGSVYHRFGSSRDGLVDATLELVAVLADAEGKARFREGLLKTGRQVPALGRPREQAEQAVQEVERVDGASLHRGEQVENRAFEAFASVHVNPKPPLEDAEDVWMLSVHVVLERLHGVDYPLEEGGQHPVGNLVE